MKRVVPTLTQSCQLNSITTWLISVFYWAIEKDVHLNEVSKAVNRNVVKYCLYEKSNWIGAVITLLLLCITACIEFAIYRSPTSNKDEVQQPLQHTMSSCAFQWMKNQFESETLHYIYQCVGYNNSRIFNDYSIFLIPRGKFCGNVYQLHICTSF